MPKDERLHSGGNSYGKGITVREHMALEILKAMIIKDGTSDIHDSDATESYKFNKRIDATMAHRVPLAVQYADELLKELE
jgi:hypothetical protein